MAPEACKEDRPRGSGTLPAMFPRPAPWVGKQTSSSVWGADEGDGMSPAHQSWDP